MVTAGPIRAQFSLQIKRTGDHFLRNGYHFAARVRPAETNASASRKKRARYAAFCGKRKEFPCMTEAEARGALAGSAPFVPTRLLANRPPSAWPSPMRRAHRHAPPDRRRGVPANRFSGRSWSADRTSIIMDKESKYNPRRLLESQLQWSSTDSKQTDCSDPIGSCRVIRRVMAKGGWWRLNRSFGP